MSQNLVSNESGLKPLGRAVLVKPYEPEKKHTLIALPDSVQARMVMIDTRVVVVECGPACWPNEPQRAKPGDRVFISQYSGVVTRGPKDDAVYRVINDNDIYLAITEES